MSDLNVGRRALIGGGAAAGAASLLGPRMTPRSIWVPDRRPRESHVAVLSADSYDIDLQDVLFRGMQLFRLPVRGKRILLKPNLVEVIPGAAVNTDVRLIGAAVEAFRKLGASEVVVAEGPGHQRDTELVLFESGLAEHLEHLRCRFVDLNRDELVRTPNPVRYTSLKELWLPASLHRADVVVSMPKVKTHHWAGVTLSMKNMFGVLPGDVYGWPKNVLHWEGIHESILDICGTAPLHFAIADGIHAMEGNGPLHGKTRPLGRLVLSDDVVAADFTCCRLMGLDPTRIRHLSQASRWRGNGDPERIKQLAERVTAPSRSFDVLPDFAALQARDAISEK